MNRSARALFVSDVHLGTTHCQADKLLQFLKSFEDDKGGYNLKQLYLVGDIVDFMSLARRNQWTSSHWLVIQKILRMSRKGVNVCYITGNHDFSTVMLTDQDYGNISFRERVVHKTLLGQDYLILHGHQFDGSMRTMGWLYILGDLAYDRLLDINKWYNRFTKLFGYSYWSLSYYLKNKVKNAVSFVNKYDTLVAKTAKAEGCKGVVAGHIHQPADKLIEGIHYLNTGAWVEISTAVVEDLDGTMRMITYQP